MLVEFRLPLVSPHMTEAVIESRYAEIDTVLVSGTKLLDISVDLSGAFAQDCPPISFFRVVLRESAALREWLIEPGARCAPGDLLAHFIVGGEDTGAPRERPLRIATAAIMRHDGMFSRSEA